MNIVFMGTPYFAAPVLEGLAAEHNILAVYTKAPSPQGRHQTLTKSPVHIYAESRGFEVRTPKSLRANFEEVLVLKPDAIIVFAYGLFLPLELVSAVPCICVHPSLLPLYRGPNPIMRPIMNGDSSTGVCLIKMDEGMDTGAILARESLDIGENETRGELEVRLAALASSMLASADLFAAGVAQPAAGTYAAKLGKEECQIDLARPALEIHNLVRALAPSPNAWALLNGEKVKVLRTAVVGGKLELLEVQKAGGKPMSYSAFLNGLRVG